MDFDTSVNCPSRRRHRAAFVALCVLATSINIEAFGGGGQYALIDLGTLAQRSSHGTKINQANQVVGFSTITGQPGTPKQPAIPYVNHAFLWSGESGMTDLGAVPSGNCSPFGCESWALGLNDDGIVAGWSATPYQLPIVWSPKQTDILNQGINQLPTLFPGNTNNTARAINNAMIVVGQCKNSAATQFRAVRWHHDGANWVVTDLGTLQTGNTGFAAAQDVNQLGQIVGQATNSSNNLDAFIWLPQPAYGLPAGIRDLTPINTNSHFATAINDNGQVVGVRGVATPWIWLPVAAYGFPAGFSLLPLYNGVHGVYPSDINNRGQIVGTAFIINGQTTTLKGVIFDNGAWTLLDTFLPAGSPWVIRNYAQGGSINDDGAISGDMLSTTILDINGEPSIHGYLLDPTSPGDVDLNGVVDVDDLLMLINAWGQCPAPPEACPADLDGNLVVDVDDLLMVINNWST